MQCSELIYYDKLANFLLGYELGLEFIFFHCTTYSYSYPWSWKYILFPSLSLSYYFGNCITKLQVTYSCWLMIVHLPTFWSYNRSFPKVLMTQFWSQETILHTGNDCLLGAWNWFTFTAICSVLPSCDTIFNIFFCQFSVFISGFQKKNHSLGVIDLLNNCGVHFTITMFD